MPYILWQAKAWNEKWLDRREEKTAVQAWARNGRKKAGGKVKPLEKKKKKGVFQKKKVMGSVLAPLYIT